MEKEYSRTIEECRYRLGNATSTMIVSCRIMQSMKWDNEKATDQDRAALKSISENGQRIKTEFNSVLQLGKSLSVGSVLRLEANQFELAMKDFDAALNKVLELIK